MNTSNVMLTQGVEPYALSRTRSRAMPSRPSPPKGPRNLAAIVLAAVLLVAFLVAPGASAKASVAPPSNPSSGVAAGPWAGVEALWDRIVRLAGIGTPIVTSAGGITGGGEVGQGLDPDGGGGDPGDDEEPPPPPPPPPPPGDGTTSTGGDGGSL